MIFGKGQKMGPIGALPALYVILVMAANDRYMSTSYIKPTTIYSVFRSIYYTPAGSRYTYIFHLRALDIVYLSLSRRKMAPVQPFFSSSTLLTYFTYLYYGL